jgi:hypothetical protein
MHRKLSKTVESCMTAIKGAASLNRSRQKDVLIVIWQNAFLSGSANKRKPSRQSSVPEVLTCLFSGVLSG